MLHTAYIGIGANLGDPLAQCQEALKNLAAAGDVTVSEISSFYRSAPLVREGESTENTPWYINAVCKIETSLTPQEVLALLLKVEASMGRTRRQKWEPRLMDLDLLLFNDLILKEPNLTLPHPEILNRNFVLIPLCEIAPTLVHPVLRKTIAELCEHVKPLKTV